MIKSLCACCVAIFQLWSKNDKFCTFSGPTHQEERWLSRVYSMIVCIGSWPTWICCMVPRLMLLCRHIEALQDFNFWVSPNIWPLSSPHAVDYGVPQLRPILIDSPEYALLIDTINSCSVMLPHAPDFQICIFTHPTWSHPRNQHTADPMRHACTVLSACYQLMLQSQSLIDSLWSWTWKCISDIMQKCPFWSKSWPIRSQHPERHKSI